MRGTNIRHELSSFKTKMYLCETHRYELSVIGLQMDTARTVTRNGTTYQQDTSNIGKAASLRDVKIDRRPSPSGGLYWSCDA